MAPTVAAQNDLPVASGEVPLSRAGKDRAMGIMSKRGLRTAPALLTAAMIVVAASAPASAAGGDLDATFGGDGRVTTSFSGGAEANAIAIQPDGMIVAAGGSGGRFALARYGKRGHLDVAFGGDGRVTTSLGASAEARAVAVQADGRIIAAGDEGDHARFALARYGTDGRLDRRFGGDGTVTTRIWRGGAFADAVAIQPDGRIIAAGQTSRGDGAAAAVVRYLADGRLDRSFGGDGVVTIRFTELTGAAYGVAIQPDGRIVIVGEGNAAGGFSVARLLPDGRLDRAFGGDGIVITTKLGGARAVALQPDGKVVVVGTAEDFAGPFAIARYLPDGERDRRFGGGSGFVTVDMGDGEENAQGVAIQPDGRIVVVGYTDVPHEFGDTGVGAFALARLRPRGRLDVSFGQAGRVLTTFDAGLALGLAVGLQSNGRIVAAGWAGGHFGLARYLPS
jgi:uncharacterized delta-60 repeat protein